MEVTHLISYFISNKIENCKTKKKKTEEENSYQPNKPEDPFKIIPLKDLIKENKQFIFLYKIVYGLKVNMNLNLLTKLFNLWEQV